MAPSTSRVPLRRRLETRYKAHFAYALSRVPTDGSNKMDLEDEIPCFLLDKSEMDLEWGAALDDMPDGSIADELFRFSLHPAPDVETIRDEEWRRDQDEDLFCSAIEVVLTSEKLTSFAVNVD